MYKPNIISITTSSPLILLLWELVISVNLGMKNPIPCTLPKSFQLGRVQRSEHETFAAVY